MVLFSSLADSAKSVGKVSSKLGLKITHKRIWIAWTFRSVIRLEVRREARKFSTMEPGPKKKSQTYRPTPQANESLRFAGRAVNHPGERVLLS
jgi:hypothetical protein